MSSSEWGAWTGGDAAGRILAALDRVDAPLDEAWVAPKGGLKPEDMGAVIAAARAKKARLEALELDLVALAEACDIGRLTGSPNATVYLRTAQRLGQREASAVVGLARALGKVARLTLEAMAAGAVSAMQAKVIAEALKKLPEYVGADERHWAEEFLIEKAGFANPDELRGMGESLLERIAPEEAERLEGEELAKKDRKAEQKRSLRYLPNGIPQSETVRITLPSWEMELFRKIIEPLAEPKKGAEPDRRPIEQRRGDAFAEALGLLAAATTAPVRGGRPPQVAVTIPMDVLLTGTGAGTIDDTATPVPPRPCTCPCTDPKYGTSKDTGNAKNAKNAAKDPDQAGEPTTEEARGQDEGQESQPGKQKRPPPGTGSPADGIPPPREPVQPPQPNTDPGTEEDDAELQRAVGLKDAIDPHDGCPRCGGGGSARYLGADGKPISAATVRRLACEADLIPVVLAGDGQVLDLGRSDRFFREHQRRALAIRDGSHCHFPGCNIPEPRCITHHMTAWDHGGPTDLNNGVLLCRFHHVTVHHKGWLVRMGSHGHPEYVPPEWVDPQQRILRP
ncbi:protein of unknown function [Actinopolymorpha cephalotaxi]|uniref:HNH nuclease domain-containing protein n=1 Tax=Actinopolymorpha cephalotaxi TaxID=504797 RepID=A0A1I2WXL1_9ACTN|nr:HNH endonuclease signature motif containing protein [Actinopolymorpha cephalotaxi]NYH85113.1 hypothetical protein [Actinopolymorpha cephalotaxi]SFH04411.1 protein of unknown function [Actinopolymorpha cephalotaxi]